MKMLGKTINHGPGGLRCTCCGPPPGKPRRQQRRTAKRAERQVWRTREVATA